jgi:glutathione S-transferase
VKKQRVEMITLYHAPRSRSSRIIWLLEELGVPYKIELTSIVRGDGTGAPAPDSYSRIHPLRKVPAIVHDGAVIYESAGIALYLTDAFPKAGIGPAVGDPKRADYVRWLFFYPSILEPSAAAHIPRLGQGPDNRFRQIRGRRGCHRAGARGTTVYSRREILNRGHSVLLGLPVLQGQPVSRPQMLRRLRGAMHRASGVHSRDRKGQRLSNARIP